MLNSVVKLFSHSHRGRRGTQERPVTACPSRHGDPRALDGFPGWQFQVNGLGRDASVLYYHLQPLAAQATQPILLNESLRFPSACRGHKVFDIENPSFLKKMKRGATGRIQATGKHR